jgi:hypothetical protein
LEVAQPPTRSGAGGLEPEPLQPDVIIGLEDWELMQAFRYSGWGAMEAVENEKQVKRHIMHIILRLDRVCKTTSGNEQICHTSQQCD